MDLVIDTNVILVANQQHGDVSPACVIECVQRLQSAMGEHRVLIDDAYKIAGEYLNKTSLEPQRGPGDIFVKWLLQNSGNVDRVSRVGIIESAEDWFEGFPSDEIQHAFDPSDRKFAAVAFSAGTEVTVLQATDCKWLMWRDDMLREGVNVDFLCPEDICRFFRNKFPDSEIPQLN